MGAAIILESRNINNGERGMNNELLNAACKQVRVCAILLTGLITAPHVYGDDHIVGERMTLTSPYVTLTGPVNGTSKTDQVAPTGSVLLITKADNSTYTFTIEAFGDIKSLADADQKNVILQNRLYTAAITDFDKNAELSAAAEHLPIPVGVQIKLTAD